MSLRVTFVSLLLMANGYAKVNAGIADDFNVTSTYYTRWTFDPTTEDSMGIRTGQPLNIAHRGASGMFPEHTQLAYSKAVEQNADYVECDVTITKDLVLICSHEPWIDDVSNVVCEGSDCGPPHADFSDRIRTYDMDDDDPQFDWNDHGMQRGYFTFDFDLDELLTLRRKQVRDYRDPLYNWAHTFITFDEYLAMAKQNGFGIYPEIKVGAATNKILKSRNVDVSIEELLLTSLMNNGFESKADPCFIQTFELTTLRKLIELGSRHSLVFLIAKPRAEIEDLEVYKELGVVGLGLDKDLVVYKKADGHIDRLDQQIIDRIHSYNMKVHVYTFRNEYRHLNWNYGQDFNEEYELFLRLGIDGYFTDFPGSLNRYFQYKHMETEVANQASSTLAYTQGGSSNQLRTSMIFASVLAKFFAKFVY